MENSKQSKFQSQKPKPFEIIQKNLATIGITPSLADQSYPFNWTILCGILILSLNIFFLSMFIIYDAETFVEFTQSVYMTTLSTLINLCLLVLILKVKNLFKLIDGCDDLVSTSK